MQAARAKPGNTKNYARAAAMVAAVWTTGLVSSDAAANESGAVRTAQLEQEGSNIAWGQAIAVVDKPIEELLPVLLDYGSYAQFMPNFTRSKVLAQRGTRAQVYMEVSVAKGTITLWGQLNIAERQEAREAHIIEAHLLEGNIDAFNARWKLTPEDDGARTHVEFNIYVDPDIPLPSSIFSRENERAAAKAVRALRARVGDQGTS